jgi:hypothetical protein
VDSSPRTPRDQYTSTLSEIALERTETGTKSSNLPEFGSRELKVWSPNVSRPCNRMPSILDQRPTVKLGRCAILNQGLLVWFHA